jgi:hypothetical protein
MSDVWRILSPLSLKDMSALEEECDRLVDEYLARHPGSRDTFGELSASKNVPKEKEVKLAYDKKGLAFPAELRAPLKACKSMLLIERPGSLDHDPLQVSVLAHVLERTEDALVAFDEAPYLRAEEVRADLGKKRPASSFGQKSSIKGDDVVIEVERSMESVRRILATFEAAEHNLDLQIDLRRILGASTTLVKRYVTLLVNQGAVDDKAASAALAVPVAEIKRAREEVESVTRAIRPADDPSFDAASAGDAADPEPSSDD